MSKSGPTFDASRANRGLAATMAPFMGAFLDGTAVTIDQKAYSSRALPKVCISGDALAPFAERQCAVAAQRWILALGQALGGNINVLNATFTAKDACADAQRPPAGPPASLRDVCRDILWAGLDAADWRPDGLVGEGDGIVLVIHIGGQSLFDAPGANGELQATYLPMLMAAAGVSAQRSARIAEATGRIHSLLAPAMRVAHQDLRQRALGLARFSLATSVPVPTAHQRAEAMAKLSAPISQG